ncbi:DNA repair protein RecN [Hutsoniella sourekii]|uniref:DNA repair protein RecN n=1 Tax=Hutsoniella sourekii TaxID=87650 RepID=UPI0004821FA0|nr:DNA repair protein RecN [Hutsoniella sourekii]
MLVSLTIDNFAIIDHVAIDFREGMTVLSGETGAGKSIIIDALGILCGGRGSVDYIRVGQDKLRVEGLFIFEDMPLPLRQSLADFGIQHVPSGELILRREINSQGKNIIRVNGHLANVSLLKTIGSYLVDIHGQNEHQALLDVSQHLRLLDQYSSPAFDQMYPVYQEAYDQFRALRQEWLEASQTESSQLQRLDFLKFQSQELTEAQLEAGEEERLQVLSDRLQNQAHIQENLQAIAYHLSEGETNVIGQLQTVTDWLKEIQDYNADYPALLEELMGIQAQLEEIAHQLAVGDDWAQEEVGQLDQIEARLSELSQLKRKYGLDIEELGDLHEEIDEEIYQIENRDHYVQELTQKLKASYDKTYQLAQELHQERLRMADNLCANVEAQLADLYMKNSRFEVQFKPTEEDKQLLDLGSEEAYVYLNRQGLDQVEFFIATNPGEPVKPLVRVASGGELSRFMLALKTVFSNHAIPKVMVFDEIDTGVSGRVAQAIAEKMYEISANHQVFAITHLPQVAAIADQQVYIEKESQNDSTTSRISQLEPERRIEILAHMMSGEAVSETSRRLAEELLATSRAKFEDKGADHD